MSSASEPSMVPAGSPSNGGKRKSRAEDEQGVADSRSLVGCKSTSSSPLSSAKRVRTIGPTLPPPNKPTADDVNEDASSHSSSSSDDDDFGPSLPTATSQKGTTTSTSENEISGSEGKSLKPVPTKTQRDEWMVVPPSSGDWTSRVDPTQLKNRKFNTGKGSRGQGPNSGNGANPGWTETSDEKVARLQREVLGVKDATTVTDTASITEQAAQKENSRRLREYNVWLPLSVSTLYRHWLKRSRRPPEVLHSTNNTRRIIRKRKTMTLVLDPSIAKRTSLLVQRSHMPRNGR